MNEKQLQSVIDSILQTSKGPGLLPSQQPLTNNLGAGAQSMVNPQMLQQMQFQQQLQMQHMVPQMPMMSPTIPMGYAPQLHMPLAGVGFPQMHHFAGFPQSFAAAYGALTTPAAPQEAPKKAAKRKPCIVTSEYRGVSYHRRDKCWLARVWLNNRIKHLGCYKDEEMAALVVDLTLVAIHGPNTRTLNFPSKEKRDELIKKFEPIGNVKLKAAVKNAAIASKKREEEEKAKQDGESVVTAPASPTPAAGAPAVAAAAAAPAPAPAPTAAPAAAPAAPMVKEEETGPKTLAPAPAPPAKEDEEESGPKTLAPAAPKENEEEESGPKTLAPAAATGPTTLAPSPASKRKFSETESDESEVAPEAKVAKKEVPAVQNEPKVVAAEA